MQQSDHKDQLLQQSDHKDELLQQSDHKDELMQQSEITYLPFLTKKMNGIDKIFVSKYKDHHTSALSS